MNCKVMSQQQIDDLRKDFLKELEVKGESSFHPIDIEKAKSNDNWLKRFLLHHDSDEKLALAMMWDVLEWRKKNNINEITESNVRMEYLIEGGFFPRGRDKDGAALFIFKCKKHVKGSRDMDDLKRCVQYWFERLEKEEKGQPITLFFDMEGCGLSNMDMEFTQYLIGMFKQHYPYFLNYIIIFEMAWILNAAFKIIKSWMPEKAVQKIKMVKKADIGNLVPMEQALKCWGGQDDYVFSFVPQEQENSNPTSTNNKKVHFADGSPMSEGNPPLNNSDGGLSISPSSVINFVKDGDEFISSLQLLNNDSVGHISYKMKTTAPEKYRVRPSTGILAPGDRATITVTLLPAYQIGNLSKDKFLVMSIPIDSNVSPNDLAEKWKNVSDKSVCQHRLKCSITETEVAKNGSVPKINALPEQNQIAKLTSNVAQLQECQAALHKAVWNTQVLQYITMTLVVILGAVLFYLSKANNQESNNNHNCYRHDEI